METFRGAKNQSWALALFSQVHSPLNFYPWFAIALSLIFRFAHHSIALNNTSGSLLLKSTKTLLKSRFAQEQRAISMSDVPTSERQTRATAAISSSNGQPRERKGGGFPGLLYSFSLALTLKETSNDIPVSGICNKIRCKIENSRLKV